MQKSYKIKLLIIATGLLTTSLTFQISSMVSTSMEGTINKGEPLSFEKLNSIERNQIVLFKYKDFYSGNQKWVFRIVGKSGDKIQITNGDLIVNDQKVNLPAKAKWEYYIHCKSMLNGDKYPTYELTLINKNPIIYQAHLTNTQLQEIKKDSKVIETLRFIQKKSLIYETVINPIKGNNWNMDFFGPLSIPKIGDTVHITEENYKLYRNITDKKSGELIIKENLYFFLGDNRHNAADSRFIGFIPESSLEALVVQ
ncbi:signal peptidase I [Solitalea longa]|uniref:Signal peptidase I n=1 Tax=Solitalea longa TaxID=2079460 RepID=A0A2S4ZWJ0_9SPHI|nr:signal peptidase I [Solitalea longa]POY34656.1 signal peptidase I [Solitalea longa]